MVTAEHVAAIRDTLRALADEGADGKAARDRIALAALESVDVAANADLARDLLVAELGARGGDLLAEVMRLEAEGAALDADAEGMLWLDLALVRVLERIDAGEGATAREVRAREAIDPAVRWKLWADPEAPFGLVRFAGVIWSRTVAERWRRGVDRPAAMVRAVAAPLHRLAQGATFHEASGEVRDANGERIAGVKSGLDVTTLDVEVMRRGLERFRGTASRRLVRFLAHEAHRGEVRGEHRPDIVSVDGGLVGLAELIGCDPRKDAQRVRDLLHLGGWIDLSIGPLEVHGLWTWNTLAEAPGRRARLEVNLNPCVFLSGAAEQLKAAGGSTRDARAQRLLVPILRTDPPFRVPQRRERGRVWSVADAVLVRLVDSAAELASEGGVRIGARAWARLVADAELDEARARVVRDLLLEGDGEAPMMLRWAGGDRYTLADTHATELAFILSRVDSGRRKP